jgi:hypothetical protein
MIGFLLYYVGIGLILALPLIYVVEEVDEVPRVTPYEVFLTIFLWPWLWILLIKMFVQFLIKELCTWIK